MNKKIMVLDDVRQKFRKLNPKNYNDDWIVGAVFFERRALDIIKKEFIICGYIIISEDGEMYPIDIHDTEIILLEGTYNCLPENIKKELIEYNIQCIPKVIWSRFFFKWQFLGEWNAFEESGSFIETCSNIIGDEKKCNLLIREKANVVFPTSYGELCQFTKNIQTITGINFFDPDYIENVSYTLDSLLKGYRINMLNSEIDKYCYQICTLVNNKWED